MPVDPLHWEPALPPWRERADGGPRRVGVELELIGPDVATVGEVVSRVLDGRVEPISRYELHVRAESGTWGVELDFELLKDRERRAADMDDDPSGLEELAEEVIRFGAEAVVPVEVVSPPLPMDRLGEAQALVPALREIGGRGTGAGIAYAFGLHLNPELPRLDAPTILAYLRAFLCLYDWLVRESRVDLTRRLTRYSAPFPTSYVRRVVDADYSPALPDLIDDYLADNPTRNRALDLLPLFTELDSDRVRSVVDDSRVKPRPTLHYRLPDSRVDDPEWGLWVPWRDWLEVERLAADPSRLESVCRAYSALLQNRIGDWFEDWGKDWAKEVEQWLVEPGSE